MKAKKFLMAFAAIAAVATTGCTQEEEMFVKDGDGQAYDENAITFGTYLGSAPQSRSSVMDLDALKQTGFGVLAYYTGEDTYQNEGVPGSFTPNFMYNQKVEWTGSWTYSPVKYWPSNIMDKVSFFGYAPYVENFAGKTEGIVGLTSNTTAGDPKLSFVVPEEQENMIDLLYDGSLENISKEDIEGQVQFKFKHAMSRVGFSRVAVVDELNPQDNSVTSGKYEQTLAEGTRVVINSVKLSSGEFGTSGDLNLRTGEWEEMQKSDQAYVLSKKDGDFLEDACTMTPENANEIMQLNGDDRYFMIMPSEKGTKTPVTITVNFDVITEDVNLDGGKSQITSEVSTTFAWDFLAGKSYNFVLHIALTSVKIDATVTDWDHVWKAAEGDQEGLDFDVVENITSNNSISLIYDANYHTFINGSRYYIESKPRLGKEGQEYDFVIRNFFIDPYGMDNEKNDIKPLEDDKGQIHVLNGWWHSDASEDAIKFYDSADQLSDYGITDEYYKPGETVMISKNTIIKAYITRGVYNLE
ncbi:MAG: fimbrillin family protein [Clostridium sp.]|nr:fimbrillin family protein [Clostridium sp.]